MEANGSSLSLLLNYESDHEIDSGYTSEEDKKRKANFGNPNERKKRLRKVKDDVDMSPEYDELPALHSPHINSRASPSGLKNFAVEYSDHGLNYSRATTHIRSAEVMKPEQSVIPLPAELISPRNEYEDNPQQHGGRIRSFPHERGNWASLVYIPVMFGSSELSLQTLVALLISTCQNHRLNIRAPPEFHISLSRTLVLRLQWIKPLVDEIKRKLCKIPKFSMWLQGLSVYLNEEKTRTFLGIKVGQGKNEMKEIVNELNHSLLDYNLPSFYEDCSFHVSIGWCVGNVEEELRKLIPVLEEACKLYFTMESDMKLVNIKEVHFKTGNRVHRIQLGETS